MRTPLLPALVLLLLVAGCAAPPAAPDPGAAGGLVFQDLQQLPGDRLGAEPNLAGDDAGNMWVIAVGSVLAQGSQNVVQGAVNLWHSGDSGATWARQRDPGPQDKEGTLCSCDTDVDLGPDGTLYITDFWVGAGFNGFTNEASRDGGATWEPGSPVTVLQPAGNDRQYIVAGQEPDEVYLGYFAGGPGALLPAGGIPVPTQLPLGGLQLWRSADAGRTWTQQSQLADDGFIARPHVGPEGTVYYGWVSTEPGAEDGWNATATIHIARSADKGVTWEAAEAGVAPDGVGGLWPMEFDVGPDGLVHVVWMERVPAGGSVLRYTRSADGGATFEAPRVVGWADGTALLPWISHAGPGRAAVAFYGTPVAVEPLLAPADTVWQIWALTVEGDRASPPVAVAPWPVKVGTFCPRGAACPQDRELLDYPAVLWRAGWVHVAFAASLLDEGAGPSDTDAAAEPEQPRGGHSTNALVYAARARWP